MIGKMVQLSFSFDPTNNLQSIGEDMSFGINLRLCFCSFKMVISLFDFASASSKKRPYKVALSLT